MKDSPKTLKKYFKKKFSSLSTKTETLQIINNLLAQVPKNISKIFINPVLVPQKREIFHKIRSQFLNSFEISPSWAEFIQENIQGKFAKIEKLEKDIEIAQEKIGLIEQYEDYLADHRKPNISEKIEPISYYIKEKEAGAEYLNSLTKDKKNFFKLAGELAESIQVLYKEIEEDQKYLDEINERILKIRNNYYSKPLKKPNQAPQTNISTESVRVMQEIPETELKNELSISKSQTLLNCMTISFDLLNFSEISEKHHEKFKKKLSLAINDSKKQLEGEPKKFINDQILNSLVKSKSSKLLIGDLSRTNQERLAMIENRLRCGEAIHGLISPKLERLKRQEKDLKGLTSLSPRIPHYAQIPEKYKKLKKNIQKY